MQVIINIPGRIVEKAKKLGIDLETLALETIIRLKSDYYWEIINRQTSYRKKVLFAISNGVREIFSKETTSNYNLGSVSTTQKALDVFIEDGLVEKMGKSYILSDPLLKLFINQNL